MSPQVRVRLPDGSVREVAHGTTVPTWRRASARGSRRPPSPACSTARSSTLDRPLARAGDLRILTKKDPEALDVLRHSAAHLLAMAVLDLFPGTDLGFGPATDEGFYYDFKPPVPFQEERPPADRGAHEGDRQGDAALPARRDAQGRREGAPRQARLRAEGPARGRDPRGRDLLLRLGRLHRHVRGPARPRHVLPRGREGCSRSAAPTGAATRRASRCSGSTAPRSSPPDASTRT